ncbi:MAG: energy transducer TonB, partial [Cyanobacteria bacterium J06648_11]
DLPPREPAPESVARNDAPIEPEAPAPVEYSAPQLDPLLDSFRSDEPPQLLELPARSPVAEPEATPQPDPLSVVEPEPTRRPPPPLAVLPSPPAPVAAPTESAGEELQTETEVADTEAIAPAPPAPDPQAALPGPTELARPIPGRQRQPAYPDLAQRRNQEGRVMVRARVDNTGRVVQVEVTNSSGYLSLDEAAVSAVERWQFTPARRGEDAIASWVNVPIDFSLQ